MNSILISIPIHIRNHTQTWSLPLFLRDGHSIQQQSAKIVFQGIGILRVVIILLYI